MPPRSNGRTPRAAQKPQGRHAAPMLLTNADYYGALAAVRSLGRNGVPVTVAQSAPLCAASWSRFATDRTACPEPGDSMSFLKWLLEFGRRSPGHVLYPASDDVAFIYARHRQQLSEHFELYQPPFEATYALLNKRRLYAETIASGLSAPRTWFPQTETDFEQLRREIELPVMIKPVTQMLYESHRKGVLVTNADLLWSRYQEFCAEPYSPELLAIDPTISRPMVQEFHAHAAESIYSLSGFIDQDGNCATRASTKVLQMPRRLGVGICFEEAAVDPALVEGITTLCRRVGYYGVFEAEFLQGPEGRLLIDFNPRFFGQMGFDLARGLPLVMLAYEAALGHREHVARILRTANAARPNHLVPPVYCHRIALGLLLGAQRLSGAMARAEIQSWRDWSRNHLTIDAVLDEDDWMPAAVDLVSRVSSCARHPRSFVRSVVLNQ